MEPRRPKHQGIPHTGSPVRPYEEEARYRTLKRYRMAKALRDIPPEQTLDVGLVLMETARDLRRGGRR